MGLFIFFIIGWGEGSLGKVEENQGVGWWRGSQVPGWIGCTNFIN